MKNTDVIIKLSCMASASNIKKNGSMIC